nr:ArgE/DapE family deacylase [Microlunatus panaciterrae]
MTRDEARALAAVDEPALVRLLIELLAVPSVGGTAAESEIQHLLAEQLGRLELDVDLWPVDLVTLAADPGYPGAEVVRTEAWGLVATSDPTEQPALILQGHADVVPAGNPDLWWGDPFAPTLRDGTVVARGACDMKAGLAANIAAVQAVRSSGVRLRSGLALHSVIGEEDGGLGAFATLARGHRGRACVITEPTGLSLITATAGALTFRIEVSGLATHGSTRYRGHSAIDSYLTLHAALAELEQERNREPEQLMSGYPIAYPLSVGRLSAGTWSSSVPDHLVAEGRLGLRIEEDPGAARKALEARVAEVAATDPWLRDHPVGVSWPGGQFSGGRLPAGHPLASLVGGAHADSTGTAAPAVLGAPYGSDLRLYAAAGIPTLHYGPGAIELAHGPNESVRIDEVVTATRTLVVSILRACGTR